MAIITTGNNFGATDAVTNTKLNNIANAATFDDPVDETSLELITSGTNIGKLQIKDNGVTLAKMATQADQTVLGNVSGGTAVPTAVSIVGASGILINDDALGTNDTKGATQGNIKAYVDTTVAATRSFSKPDFIGTFAAIPASDTDVTITHSLGTTDLIYFIQMKLPSGAITQMNPALTYPYSNNTKPAGLSVFIETNTFSCRSGYGWAWWREQGEGTGNSASNISADSDRTNYQFRIIAYKLS